MDSSLPYLRNFGQCSCECRPAVQCLVYIWTKVVVSSSSLSLRVRKLSWISCCHTHSDLIGGNFSHIINIKMTSKFSRKLLYRPRMQPPAVHIAPITSAIVDSAADQSRVFSSKQVRTTSPLAHMNHYK